MRRIVEIVSIAGVVVGLCSCSIGGSSKSSTKPTTSSSRVPSIVTVAATVPVATSVVQGSQVSDSAGGASATSTSTPTATTASSSGRTVTSPNDSVTLGDHGTGVRQIQEALKVWGFNIAADGVFGDVTLRAVKQFQSKNGLTVDGVVGPATWKKLGQAPSSTTTTSARKTTTTTTKR